MAFCPRVYPVWDSGPLGFDYFLFHVGEVFNSNLFKNFLIPFLFLFFFWEQEEKGTAEDEMAAWHH